jgi:hypothetical protein
MRISKTALILPAVALAVAFSPSQHLRAATLANLELRAQADNLIYAIASKTMKPRKTKTKTPKTQAQGGKG